MNRRILIFTDNWPYGKSEPFFGTEMRYLSQSFDKVTILPLEKGSSGQMREIPGNTDIIEPLFSKIKNKAELIRKGLFNLSPIMDLFREGIKSRVWLSAARFRIWATHFLLVRGLLAGIRQRGLLNTFNSYDILYFYWGLRWSQILPFLGAEIHPEIAVRFHGSDLYEHTNSGYIPWRAEQLSRIDKAIAISDTGEQYMMRHYPQLTGKICVSRIGTLDYGINPWFRTGKLRVVSCSNLVPVKRVGLIVKIFGFMKITVEWVHFGDGPEISVIKTLIKMLPDNVKADLRGAVAHSEVMEYYAKNPVDLFINVSSSEGVPVSVMEALSFGIPVIATNVGGTSEIVSERTGLLIATDFSPKEIAGEIQELIQGDNYAGLRSGARAEWEEKCMAEVMYPGFIDYLLNTNNSL